MRCGWGAVKGSPARDTQRTQAARFRLKAWRQLNQDFGGLVVVLCVAVSHMDRQRWVEHVAQSFEGVQRFAEIGHGTDERSQQGTQEDEEGQASQRGLVLVIHDDYSV